MTVYIEQDRIHDLLVEFQNSPMSIRVLDFEMAKPLDAREEAQEGADEAAFAGAMAAAWAAGMGMGGGPAWAARCWPVRHVHGRHGLRVAIAAAAGAPPTARP